MLHVYAIAETTPESLRIGLYGAPLQVVAAAGVCAVASAHYEAPQAGVEELWRHEEVVERAMAEVAALPMRFGAAVADAAELEALLRARGEEFRRLFEEVRGAVELSVRVDPAPSAEDVRASVGGDPAAPASGTEYMRERELALRSREDAERRYHEPLQALARRFHLPAGRLGATGFKAAYLVEADRVDAFAALVARLGEEGGARIACTGPWPPYSFVSGERS
jgi:hypothetical protein